MSAEAWYPSEDDQYLAREAYLLYASGIAIINNPNSMVHLHAQKVTSTNLSEIAVAAEGLLRQGAEDVIRFAHPPDKRGRLIDLEHGFEFALPHMRRTVEATYEEGGEQLQRIQAINPLFGPLRPAAMLDSGLYKYICHRRWDRANARKLISPFSPSPILVEAIERRTQARV